MANEASKENFEKIVFLTTKYVQIVKLEHLICQKVGGGHKPTSSPTPLKYILDRTQLNINMSVMFFGEIKHAFCHFKICYTQHFNDVTPCKSSMLMILWYKCYINQYRQRNIMHIDLSTSVDSFSLYMEIHWRSIIWLTILKHYAVYENIKRVFRQSL